MIVTSSSKFSRRRWLEKAAGAAALGSVFKLVERDANAQAPRAGGVNSYSAPDRKSVV